MRKLACVFALLLLAACGGPPKPTVPALTPEQAGQLLQFNNKAADWIKYVKRQNAACEYRLDLPDQSNHPTSIDLDHIVLCGNRPSPKEFDASVSFAWDADQQHWVITRFAS